MSLFTNLLKKSVRDFLRKRRKVLITVTLIFALLIGLNYILNKYVDQVVGELIRDFVEEKSEGFYRVQFDDIGYILNDGRFLMNNFRFDIHPDRKASLDYKTLNKNYLYEAEVPRLHIDIIDFWSILVRRKLRVIGIEIRSPSVKIINLNKNTKPKKITFEAGNLYKALSVHLSELKINDFAIIDGTIDFETVDGPDYEDYYIHGLTFELKNFQVNEQSAERNDKIFYTDDIFLEVKDQEILLRDSLHKISFDNFYLSTARNELGFNKLKLSRRESTLTDKRHHDHYEISLPQLRFAGIDFISAYNDNFLFIDSIKIKNPEVSVTKRLSKNKDSSERDSFLDILMMYHDYLEIDHFDVIDGNLDFTDDSRKESMQYMVDQMSATLTKFKLDTGHSTTKSYGFDFDKIELTIRDYELSLPDSMNIAKFAELTIESSPLTLSLRDLVIQPEMKNAQEPGAHGIYANVPYLVMKDFDVLKAVNQDTFEIEELYVENPEISLALGPRNSGGQRKSEGTDMNKMFSKVVDFANLIVLEKFSIRDGQFGIKGHKDSQIEALSVNNLDVLLEHINIDSNSSSISDLISRINFDIQFSESELSTKSANAIAKAMQLSSNHGQLKLDSIAFLLTPPNNEQQISVGISPLHLSGLDLEQLIDEHILQVDTLEYGWINAKIESNTPSSTLQTTLTKSKRTKPLPNIHIKNLIGENGHISYEKDNVPIFAGHDIEFNIQDLTIDQQLSDEPINQFDYSRINKILVGSYYLLLSKQQHLFNAHNLLWENNQEISMRDISLVPYDNPNNKYNIKLPMISMSGVDLKKILKESYYSSESILIEQPEIVLQLSKGEQQNLSSLDLGFIPLLMRNQFHGVRTQKFCIRDGSIQVNQRTDSDSIVVECDAFNLVVDDFEVDSTTRMLPERFLFAHDVKLNGDYLSIFKKGAGNFTSINHFDISTLEKDLRFEGIYFATNTKDLANQDKSKLTIEQLEITNMNFFELTQNRILHLDGIDIDQASFVLTPKEKETQSTGIEMKRLSFPSDSMLVEDIEKSLDYEKLFGKKQKSSKSKSSRNGLNIHEKEYLFDTLILKQVDIDEILLKDSKLVLEHPSKKRNDLSIMDIRVEGRNLRYDPLLAGDSSRIFYTDEIDAKISNFKYVLPDTLSSIKFDELHLSSADSSLNIFGFGLEPRVSKFDYGPAKGYQSTWLKINNDSINAAKVDFLGIINNRYFDAKKVDIHTLEFEIYRDKRIDFPEWQRRPLPQVELHNLDFTILLDTINLFDGYIGYQEHAEKSDTPGEIFFTDLKATVVNISNDSTHLMIYPKTSISAQTEVFGKGQIFAEFQFDMIDPENIHTYGVEVDSFDLAEFNRILIPNAAAQIKSGMNERIMMTAKANEDYSYGEMRFYYNDLKVQLLNRETETPKGLGNVLGSFFANTFIIRTNNPKNFVLRKGEIFFERDKKRAIFNYWAKTFLSGVVSSIGAANNKKKIRKMHEQNLRKTEEQNSEHLTIQK